jgi:hypothetical protein
MNTELNFSNFGKLADLIKSRTPVRNVAEEHTQSISTLDRGALAITNRVGSMGFFFC